jgi:hypothetical protein
MSAMMRLRAYLPLVAFTIACFVVEGALVVGLAFLGGALLCHLSGMRPW